MQEPDHVDAENDGPLQKHDNGEEDRNALGDDQVKVLAQKQDDDEDICAIGGCLGLTCSCCCTVLLLHCTDTTNHSQKESSTLNCF